MFATSKNLEAGKPGTWTGYKVYLTAEGLVPFIIKFCLFICFVFISGLRHHDMGKRNQKKTKNVFSILPWYLHWYNHTWPSHSWPTAHQPVPWKEKHTHKLLQILREDMVVTLGRLTLLCYFYPSDLASYGFPEIVPWADYTVWGIPRACCICTTGSQSERPQTARGSKKRATGKPWTLSSDANFVLGRVLQLLSNLKRDHVTKNN